MTKLAAVLAAAVLVLAGCGGASGSPGARTLTVSAAASLTNVFGELKQRFETDNPGVDVRINFAGSSDLASQILAGAPSGVFASANTAQMDKVVAAGLVAGVPQIFVTNRLQIAVVPGNPTNIQGFADLARPDVTLVVCAPQVPCGAATEKVEQAAGVRLDPVSEEPNVRAVLSKVTSGNADAGLVYVTDVASADGRVDGVGFPESENALNSYPIAVLTTAAEPELARMFVELVRSEDGQRVLKAAGFGTP
ncbi:MAG: molybdate ABC transporter substrate-binding protein [Pseudonocardia sp.]